MNAVVLIGRLAKDPEMRQSDGKSSVAEFSIAVDKKYKKEGQPTASFFRCKAFGQTAEYICKYLEKGRLVAISGYLDQREYNTRDGQKREAVEIIVNEVKSLERGQSRTNRRDDEDPFADD